MYIKRIKLLNYKQFLNQEIIFKQCENGISIFTGVGASGKTVLFDAIRWCLSGIIDDAGKAVNNKLLKTLPIGSVVEASVEIEFSYNNTDMLVRRVIRGSRAPRVKLEHIELSMHLYSKNSDGNWVNVNESKVFPSGHELYMYMETGRIISSNPTRILEAIEGCDKSIHTTYNALEYCAAASRQANSMLINPDEIEKINENILQLNKYVANYTKEREEILASVHTVMDNEEELTKIIEPLLKEESEKTPTVLMRELNELRSKRVELASRLKGIESKLASAEKQLEIYKKKQNNIKQDSKQDRIKEILLYINELDKWLHASYDIRRKELITSVNESYKEIMRTMGFEKFADEGIETVRECSSWRMWLNGLVLILACREVYFKDSSSDKKKPAPLMIDYDFSWFGEYECEKVVRYLSELPDQVIVFTHNSDSFNKYAKNKISAEYHLEVARGCDETIITVNNN